MAQLAVAFDLGSKCCGFESLYVYHFNTKANMKLEDCKPYDIVKTTRTREDGKPVFGQLGETTPGVHGGPTADGEIGVTYGYINEYTDWVKPEALTAIPKHPDLVLNPLPKGSPHLHAAVTPEGEIISVNKENNWAYGAAIRRFCDDFSVPQDITYGCSQVDREAATWLGYRVYPVVIAQVPRADPGRVTAYTITLYARK